ncbi:ankyrin repeat and death domain-containing protein 1A-like isoform X2 [Coccinella septempunctata]|uniref:ankyrin repeat and death domain-containing protein 1A-like isoform X2 n=1 Tax=Coccinella septempunctata TaxID=41139 RepID=UPI001D0942CA|nr:ankyrin repeat and death domain-containing protein 1A-like isoform X2 [Coccinella septempunctata]
MLKKPRMACFGGAESFDQSTTRPFCPSPTSTPEELERRAIIQRNDLLLHEAVIKNDTKGVQRILREPVDVNSRNNYGRAPIHWASSRGNLDIMEMLMSCNCDIEARDKKGYTILMCAARNNRIEVIDFLLDSLEDLKINAVDNEGQTALFHAALGGHTIVVQRLIDRGAIIDTKNKDSQTALHVACERGHEEVTKLLLAHEADMETKDINDNTPLHIAAQHQQTSIVQVLLDAGADPDSENEKGSTALHISSSLGSRGILELLIQHCANINKQNKAGNTPLHLACQANEIDIVESLISRGANLNSLNTRLQSPIHIAAEMGHTDICKSLLAAGADIEQREQGGRTPLYIAARGSFTAIVDMIIKTARLDYPPQDDQSNGGSVRERQGRSRISRSSSRRKWSVRASRDETQRLRESERLREILYKLAYKQLGPGEWKKLAQHWAFTDDQIKAIEHQYNGPSSYKEHGFRMLLIWVHGLGPEVNPIKEIYESLTAIGRRPLADSLRRKIDQEIETRRKGSKRRCSSCSIC